MDMNYTGASVVQQHMLQNSLVKKEDTQNLCYI